MFALAHNDQPPENTYAQYAQYLRIMQYIAVLCMYICTYVCMYVRCSVCAWLTLWQNIGAIGCDEARPSTGGPQVTAVHPSSVSGDGTGVQ